MGNARPAIPGVRTRLNVETPGATNPAAPVAQRELVISKRLAEDSLELALGLIELEAEDATLRGDDHSPEFAELVESVKDRGVLREICVRVKPGTGKTPGSTRYILIDGRRRYRASEAAGRATIRARNFGEITPLEARALQVILNEQTKPTSRVDIALAVAELFAGGYTIEDLERAFVKKRAILFKYKKVGELLAGRLTAEQRELVRVPVCTLKRLYNLAGNYDRDGEGYATAIIALASDAHARGEVTIAEDADGVSAEANGGGAPSEATGATPVRLASPPPRRTRAFQGTHEPSVRMRENARRTHTRAQIEWDMATVRANPDEFVAAVQKWTDEILDLAAFYRDKARDHRRGRGRAGVNHTPRPSVSTVTSLGANSRSGGHAASGGQIRRDVRQEMSSNTTTTAQRHARSRNGEESSEAGTEGQSASSARPSNSRELVERLSGVDAAAERLSSRARAALASAQASRSSDAAGEVDADEDAIDSGPLLGRQRTVVVGRRPDNVSDSDIDRDMR